jgi:hypothetical protein
LKPGFPFCPGHYPVIHHQVEGLPVAGVPAASVTSVKLPSRVLWYKGRKLDIGTPHI